MRVRRFVAPDVQKALAKVKAEMGDEAVILHVRPVREGGFLGFFGQMMTEVTAALEEKSAVPLHVAPAEPKTLVSEPVPVKKIVFNPLLNTAPRSPIPPVQQKPVSSMGSGEQPIARSDFYLTGKPVEVQPGPTAKTAAPVGEIRELRHAIEQMSKQMMVQLEEIGTKDKLQGMSKLQQQLTEKELDEGLVQRILKKVVDKAGQNANPEQVRAMLVQELTELVKRVVPIVPVGKKPLVVALVGPTGVGKTTTIAKLAANFCLVEKRKVALLTADTYRVAAVDQLKTFAEIIRVPVEVVVSPNSIREAIDRHRDKDIIFIDTAGRSPNNQIHLSELRVLLEKANPDRVFLTISATTRCTDMLDIVDKFDLPYIDSLIFTKLDETSTYGGIISLVDKTKKPLAYLTNGQNVPDDIVLANPQQVVSQVLGGVKVNG